MVKLICMTIQNYYDRYLLPCAHMHNRVMCLVTSHQFVCNVCQQKIGCLFSALITAKKPAECKNAACSLHEFKCQCIVVCFVQLAVQTEQSIVLQMIKMWRSPSPGIFSSEL